MRGVGTWQRAQLKGWCFECTERPTPGSWLWVRNGNGAAFCERCLRGPAYILEKLFPGAAAGLPYEFRRAYVCEVVKALNARAES